VVTRQLQVERRTEKAPRPKTDVLPLSHAGPMHLPTINTYAMIRPWFRDNVFGVSCYVGTRTIHGSGQEIGLTWWPRQCVCVCVCVRVWWMTCRR